MFTPEQKIEHLKNLGFDGDLNQIYNLYSGLPFNADDTNYQKLVSYSKKLCDEYTRLFADTRNQDQEIVQNAISRRNQILDILFPGHGSIYGFGEWSQAVIGLVDMDGLDIINVRCKFSPTCLVHLQEYSLIAPNVIFGNINQPLKGIINPSKIIVKDNTWVCAGVTIGENTIIGNQSVVGLGAVISENSSFNSSKLIVGNPAVEKKSITENYVENKANKKILRTDDQMRKLIQNIRNLGIEGDLEQYIRALNCENHNCLEPVISNLYILTHQLCAEFNDSRTSIIRKGIIANILFPLCGENLKLGKDLFVDLLGLTQIGNNVSIGDRVNLAGNIYIGNNVNVGNDVILQTIGHEIYYKKRQLQMHPDGYPIETNTCGYIVANDNVNIADGTKVLPGVTISKDTEENELLIK